MTIYPENVNAGENILASWGDAVRSTVVPRFDSASTANSFMAGPHKPADPTNFLVMIGRDAFRWNGSAFKQIGHESKIVTSYHQDVSTPGTGSLLLGYSGTSSTHMALDGNEIQAWSAGKGAALNLNIADPAGTVVVGGELQVNGLLDINGDVVGDGASSISGIKNITMTGQLNLGSGNIVGNGATDLHGIDVIVGVNEIWADSGSAGDPSYTFTSYKTHGFYAGSSGVYNAVNGRRAQLFGASYTYTYNSADANHWTRVGADSTWGRLETTRDWFYVNKGLRIDSGKVHSYNEALELGAWDGEKAVKRARLNADFNQDALLVYANGSEAAHGEKVLGGLRVYAYSDVSELEGGSAGLTLQSRYGTDRHASIRVWHKAGNNVQFRNYLNTAWIGLNAAAFVQETTRTAKLRKGRDEHHPLLEAVLTGDRQLAFNNHRGVSTTIDDSEELETLWEWDGCVDGRERDFDAESDDPDDVVWRKAVHATREECVEAGCKSMDNLVKKEHHCDDFHCNGTNERPCSLIAQHVDRPGFVSENVEEFYPKLVSTHSDGTNPGINLSGLVAELWNTVDHLIEECDDLRTALAEAKELKPRPRGGSILPEEPRRASKFWAD